MGAKRRNDMGGIAGSQVVRTSEDGWLHTLAKLYDSQEGARLIDDAGLGVDPRTQTISGMADAAGPLWNEWLGVASLGTMAGVGTWALRISRTFPHPVGKLVLAVGGLALVGVGGLLSWSTLTRTKPRRVVMRGGGMEFEIQWD
jgi:hypothetical protein